MAHNNSKKKEEPNTAPQPDQWYNLTLGSSFKDNSPTKFCTLRYEFKPASIDKTRTGSLHKTKDNKVTVEFQNNQPGKPKWSFEGSSEDYKDNDAVLFFDGETFRLERLHRAVKRLRHVRIPGESASAAGATTSMGVGNGGLGVQGVEARSPPLGRGSKGQPSVKAVVNAVPVEMERIDIGETKSPGPKRTDKGAADSDKGVGDPFAAPFTSTESVDSRTYEIEEHLKELFEDVESDGTPDKVNSGEQEHNTGFDINVPNQNDMEDEIADVDLSDDETGNGPNAAEALRAQVNAAGREAQTSSSSGSSDSGSSGSGSGSGSSSSDSEASDDDSVTSV